MPSSEKAGTCAVAVDLGTTNTRVWIVSGFQVLARSQASIGVRDTARDGSSARLRAGLREAIQEARAKAAKLDACSAPAYVAAAGMITSPLGLVEIPHLAAPAGLEELAAGVRPFHFPDVCDLPFFFVPGIRTGPLRPTPGALTESDVMRGEETLCIGLVALDLARTKTTVLNLGSHWKAIQIGVRGRIESSVTSISGELIHATQTQTILASAVPHERPAAIDRTWCAAGMEEQRRSGLARALFCVRLLELGGASSPEQRLSFLIGAFIAADLDALLARNALARDGEVLICGGGPVADAWREALLKESIAAVVMDESQIERALLAGLRSILELSFHRMP